MKTLKLFIALRNSAPVRKLETALKSKDGGVVAENGILIAGIAAVVVVVITLVIAFTKGTFFPELGKKIMEIFSMS